jgi:hypothetical protein
METKVVKTVFTSANVRHNHPLAERIEGAMQTAVWQCLQAGIDLSDPVVLAAKTSARLKVLKDAGYAVESFERVTVLIARRAAELKG